MHNRGNHLSRRSFLGSVAGMGAAAWIGSAVFAEEAIDPRTAAVVASTIGIDAHNHVDVPLTAAEVPGPDLDLEGEMVRSGLSAIAMTFATDYQSGDAYERFRNGMTAMSRQLERNGMRRSLTAGDVRAANAAKQPTVIQAVEGAHFLQGHLERVEEAYRLGLRHFGLLHDSDSSVPLGDVYTNPPMFGGLTDFGAAVIRECNRLGMLVDLAHATEAATAKALHIATRPVVISHTGLDTQLGNNPRMAQMMRPRLIGEAQAKMVADAGGAVGVWTHLADTPLEYARNIRALVDVIGVDHVMLGTDTKLTPPTPRLVPPPNSGSGGPNGGQSRESPPSETHGPQGGPNPQRQRAGERTNDAWSGEAAGFYYTVVDAMLKTGFSAEEIAKIGGGNYLRILAQSAQ